MDRHTSIPDSLGSIRSSRTRSGSTSSNRRRASVPSRATVTSNPSRARPITRASTKDSSSSASSTRVMGGSACDAAALCRRRPCSCRHSSPHLPSCLLTCDSVGSGGVLGRVAGRTRVKVEPSPSRESTSTRPWWLLATWRTIDSPSPVPPGQRLRPWSTR